VVVDNDRQDHQCCEKCSHESLGNRAPFVDRGDRMAGSQRDDLLAAAAEYRVSHDEQRASFLLNHSRERGIDVACAAE